MELSKATIGILATLCISAGAGAAYLATRSDPPVPASPSAEATAETSAETATAETAATKTAATKTATVTPSSSASAVAVQEPATEQISVTAGAALLISRPALRSEASSPPEPPVATRRAVLPERETEPVVETALASPALTPELDALPTPEVPLGTQSLVPPVVTPVRPLAPEPVRAIEPPSPEFEEFVVSTDSVVGLQVETLTTSDNAQVEDEVVAHVTRDVRVRDRVVIPAGSVARGEVTLVERGGRLRVRARLGVRFTLVVLTDGTRIPIDTDMIYREGDARGVQSASRISGGAIGGAILGGIFGGKRGAAIGGSVGAGAGTAAALAGARDPAVLRRGAAVTVRITAPTTVILPRE